ncbi:tetratricopeptide repeat protein [Legionella micdadei]|uniref:tetratricopeptide repeat protein n=1 Tax=Legionella micdadei TaxID=451 RepID=UPI003A7F63A0
MKIFWLFLLSIFACHTYAFSWVDLWSTKDQQAQHLMKKGQFKQAETTFQQADWRAAAAYRAGDYEQAAKEYQLLRSEQGYYNQGNALAHLGQYKEAIKAYSQALAINPNNKDALFNRKLLEDLLKQNQNQQNQQDQKQNQNKDQQSQNQQNKDQQGQNQQSQNQQNKDQQGQNQQSQNQQNKDQQGQNQQSQNQQNKDQQGQNQQGQNQQAKQGDQKEGMNNTQSAEELEKQQAKEQWLRLIPDDPGGLMREKFLRDHLRREGGWYQ